MVYECDFHNGIPLAEMDEMLFGFFTVSEVTDKKLCLTVYLAASFLCDHESYCPIFIYLGTDSHIPRSQCHPGQYL